MTQKDWILLLVPTIISLIGFGVTIAGFIVSYNKMKKEYRNSLDEKLYIQKKEIYLKVTKFISNLDRIIQQNEAYENDIDSEYSILISELKLFAPQDIVDDFLQCYAQLNKLLINRKSDFINLFNASSNITCLINDMRNDLGVQDKLSEQKNNS